ncbi:hypothetical protein PHYBOEH_011479 [Phytophthora boehmeriae]|uniref:Uncharacterized protein n=1 Tax=Phytophthora boehmeriae TaxID=109152 RepID=A0A8T1VJL6_9STRA|nr:hypothetical protein PHYBOEH_011479 [Phytophthora boehmeriae]
MKTTVRRAGSTSHVWGYVIVLTAGFVFISAMYVLVFSKLLLLVEDDSSAAIDTTSSSLLLALERDVYYCYLLPLTIPVTILACYANWVSLKFFRHN